MKPRLELRALKKVSARDVLVRFVFGGVVTAVAGLLAERFGPDVGGLSLAFPAILPAALTMTKSHDGRSGAVDDARGARLGAVGLGVFALVVYWSAPIVPPWAALLFATAAWLVTSILLWFLVHHRSNGAP